MVAFVSNVCAEDFHNQSAKQKERFDRHSNLVTDLALVLQSDLYEWTPVPLRNPIYLTGTPHECRGPSMQIQFNEMGCEVLFCSAICLCNNDTYSSTNPVLQLTSSPIS